MVLCSILSTSVLGSKFRRTRFATQLLYKLKLWALGLAFLPSCFIMPSFVLVGYAIPLPNVFVNKLPSAPHSLHLPSTSYYV